MEMDHKKVKLFHSPGDVHQLTFSCYRRHALLLESEAFEQLAVAIDDALVTHCLNLSAFVFMPEHVHLLIWPKDPQQGNVSRFLKSLKMSSSSRMKARFAASKSPWMGELMVRERPGKKCFRFWQEGPGHDRNLRTPAAIEASIDYIHTNPVKRGLCLRAEGWVWSSYRHYLLDASKPPPPKPAFTRLAAELLDR